MTELCAYHLPGLGAEPHELLPLAATSLVVPQLGARSVALVWRHLEAGAAGWREHALAARAERLAVVAAALRERGPGEWSDLLARSTGLSPAGLAAAWEVTFAPYDAPALLALLDTEGLDRRAHGSPRWPRRIAHVLAGNVLPPTFAMLVRGWLLGAAQWLRPAAREPLFAAALAAHLHELASELAPTFAVSWWPHGAEMEAAVLGAADLVTAQGDDTSVAALRARAQAVAPRARYCGYGDRWSVGLLSRQALTPANAAGVARDVSLFDGQGCLSPSVVLVEECAETREWCAALAAALGEEETRQPRGPRSETERAGLRAWRESMRLGIALGSVCGLWESHGSTAWACALLAPECALPALPLDRHVPVLPFVSEAGCMRLLGAGVARLQGIAADLRGWDAARAATLVAQLAPTRVALPGTLQLAPPDWRQDHLAPLGAWLPDGA